MALVRKIDSNSTGLRYAEEDSIGELPVTPVWYQLEPNDYSDFGGEVEKVARRPINDSRQRKKGVVVDLNAAGGFTNDFTPNLQTLLQGFMFADLRTKGELDVAVVDGTGNDYEPASGGTAYNAGDLLFAKLFDETVNNGLKVVSGTPAAASVPVTDTGLIAETGAEGVISRVGIQFASGLASINATVSDMPKLEVANVAASGVLTLAANPADGDTVTIGSTVYAFETGAIDTAYKVDVGATASDSIDNLIKAINLTGVAGTDYGVGTAIHPTVTASAGAGDTMNVTAKVTGAPSNSIATTETLTNAGSVWTNPTLTAGAGRDLTTLGIIPGEWVFLDDDDASHQFALETSRGFARAREIAAGYIKFDKTADTMVDDAGAGKTIRLYLGRVLKNEVGTTIVRRTYCLERSLGVPDTSSPLQVQGEYLNGAVPNEATVDFKTSDKITLELGFMANSRTARTGAEGLASGDRPTLIELDAFNSSNDVARIRLSVVDPIDSNPTPLFAFVTDLSVNINNNVSQNKAVGVLGAFDSTTGLFEVDAEMSAYFTTVESVEAVQDNEDVTLDIILAKNNQGIAIDLPLVSLGDARADVKIDEAIMLPINADAATASKLSASLNHTLLWVFFDYLPDVAG